MYKRHVVLSYYKLKFELMKTIITSFAFLTVFFLSSTALFGQTTQLLPQFCGATIGALGSNIYTDAVSGAVLYRYRIINQATEDTTIYDRDKRFFNLIFAGANPDYVEIFEIDVAVDVGGGFGPFGDMCLVFTPHLDETEIEAADCGTTKEMLFYEYLNAVPEPLADMYQFRITDGAFQSESDPVADPEIRFFEIPGYEYGKTYDVDVRLLKNGAWGPYGPSCSISTIAEPYSQVVTDEFGGTNYCGATLTSVTQRIYAFGIPGITGYRFKVSRGSYVDSIETGVVRNFRLSDLPNFAANTEYGVPYDVEVALEFDGSYTDYGVVCQVFTPGSLTQLRTDYCNITLSDIGANIYADPISGADTYRFEIDNGSSIIEYDSPTRYFNLFDAGVADYGVTYSIRVAVGISGDFEPYGSSCDVTTPTLPQTQLTNDFCDQEIAALGSNIYADAISGAVMYRYRINDGITVVEYERDKRWFNLIFAGMNPTYETLYTVEVAFDMGSGYGPYGPLCTITTPQESQQLIVNNTISELEGDALVKYLKEVGLSEDYETGNKSKLIYTPEEKFEVRIYPNPSASGFTLDATNIESDTKLNIFIHNALGQHVASYIYNSEESRLLKFGEGLQSGIYIVRFVTNGKTVTKRIVKE